MKMKLGRWPHAGSNPELDLGLAAKTLNPQSPIPTPLQKHRKGDSTDEPSLLAGHHGRAAWRDLSPTLTKQRMVTGGFGLGCQGSGV